MLDKLSNTHILTVFYSDNDNNNKNIMMTCIKIFKQKLKVVFPDIDFLIIPESNYRENILETKNNKIFIHFGTDAAAQFSKLPGVCVYYNAHNICISKMTNVFAVAIEKVRNNNLDNLLKEARRRGYKIPDNVEQIKPTIQQLREDVYQDFDFHDKTDILAAVTATTLMSPLLVFGGALSVAMNVMQGIMNHSEQESILALQSTIAIEELISLIELTVWGEKIEKLPRIKYPLYTTGTEQEWTYMYTWEDYEAFQPQKNPFYHKNSQKVINEVYNKLFPFFLEHPEILAQGGDFKGKNLNEICIELEMLYCFPGRYVGKDNEHMLRKYWKKEAIVLEEYNSTFEETELLSDELSPGEIRASVFKIGSYQVKGAICVYKFTEHNGILPLSREEMNDEEYKTFLSKSKNKILEPQLANLVGLNMNTPAELSVYQEISVKRLDSNNDKYITVVQANINGLFPEEIVGIFTAKENKHLPDDYASLFVHESWIGDARSSETLYRFSPTGAVKRKKIR